jgi:maltose alpha-D-glucosyltransferase/alpha-amylase
MAVRRQHALGPQAQETLCQRLPDYLLGQRWFGGKAQVILRCEILEVIPLHGLRATYLMMIGVHFAEGGSQTYGLPLAMVSGDRAEELLHSDRAGACIQVPGERSAGTTILYDALRDEDFLAFLLDAIARRRRFRGDRGEVRARRTRALQPIWRPEDGPLLARLLKGEQSNSSVIYGDRFILKLFRRLEEGTNPDLEIGLLLTEKMRFAHVPPVAGALEYQRGKGEPTSLAILQGFVPNRGVAWEYILDALAPYFERAASDGENAVPPLPQKSLLSLAGDNPPSQVEELMGAFLESARLLGQRTAELHLALASAPDSPDFAPEPFSPAYQQSVYQSMHDLASRVFQSLRRRLGDLPEPAQPEARQVLELEPRILRCYRSLQERKLTAMRIRIHGDYHLGQVLYTGQDFVIIDFEGEPARTMQERRIKVSALRDVAGMVRSFHYAAYSRLFDSQLRPAGQPTGAATLETWARCWYLWVSAAFLRGYLKASGNALFLPRSRQELAFLLNTYLLDKAIYELGYELNNRPTWVRLPVKGVQQALQDAA